MAQVDKSTDAGSAIIANRIKGAGTEPNYAHWGTGATAAAVTDTALQTARAEARVAGTSTRETTTVANDTYRLVTTLTCASTAAAITEYGQFDASTSGNMLLRSTFDALNLQVGDSIQFTANCKMVAS